MAFSCAQRLLFTYTSISRNLLFTNSFKPNYACPRILLRCTFKSHNNVSRFHAKEKSEIQTSKDLLDEALFDEGFIAMSAFLTDDVKAMTVPRVSEWLQQVLQYNVPHGKKNRGLGVLKTYKHLNPDGTLEQRKLAVLLGWCVELLQAFFLVMDDVMDQSVTRRGMPCWFRQKEVGLTAINDAILLESGIYRLLKYYFSNHPNYLNLVDLFHEITHFTSLGQCLDMLSNPSDNARPNLDLYTEQRHLDICKLKTAYYTFCLPVHLALLLAMKGDSYTKGVEELLLTVGHFFQVQDDYLDCFGDPAVTGKQGTDIMDGKCSWPIVIALQRVAPDDKIILKEHYGQSEAASKEKVMEIYRKVDIPGCFELYETETYKSICERIAALPDSCHIPAQVFHGLLNKVYKRSK